MKHSLRSLLLLTTALMVVGCDDSSNNRKSEENAAQGNIKIEQDPNNGSIVGFYMPTKEPIVKTIAGDYLAGQHAQYKNNWNKASDYFEDILNKNPQDPEVERRVMALSLGAGNFERAVSMAKKLSEKDQAEPLSALILSLNEFKHNNYEAARKQISSIKSDGLSAAITPLVTAWIDGAEGKFNPKTLQSSPSFIYQSILIADFEGNKELIKKLAKSYNFTRTPTPVSALENIADIFAKYGEKQAAKNIYNALRQAIPDETGELSAKISALATDKPIKEAEQITPQQGLARALLDTSRLLANGYEDSGLLFAQMSYFLNPKDSASLEQLAQFSVDNKQYQDAINYLTKINTDGDKKAADTLKRQIALLLEMDNKKDEAIRVLQELVDQNKDVAAQIQIGDLHRESEQYQKALDAYDQAFALLDNKVPQEYWQLLFSRGIVNERLHHWKKAEKDLTDALAYEPDQPYILNYLGYSWADRGENLEKATEMIEKAARLKPDDGAIVDSLGWVYFRTGHYKKAVKTLEDAVELQPYEAEINDHLGDAYWKVGRKQEARFQWSRALSFTKEQKEIDEIQSKIDNGLSSTDQSATQSAAIGSKEKLATKE